MSRDGEFLLVATATFGLEAVVARELEALGYESAVERPGWLGFRGDENAIARANLWLRSADRVLLELARFPAADFGELFDRTRDVRWEDFLPDDARVAVRGRSVKSKLASVPACQKIVKKAIVERLERAHGIVGLAETGPLFPVEVALLRDEARLVLDTTGAGLHKRGYRTESGGAPLKETLAAGLVLLSFFDREKPFLDPFCGAGTLAIEAALIARNRAPGLAREFVAESWPSFGNAVFETAREEARDRLAPPLSEPIEASDRDDAVVRLARRAAEKASVSSDIRFARKDFREVASPREFGCLVTNPPYGDRSGEAQEVRALYRAIPEVFRRFPTWSFFVLTARRDFESVLGQEADRRRKLFNGDIECTYFQFHGPRAGRETTEPPRPAFGGLDDRAWKQAELFRNRLKKRAHHLRKWPKSRETDCYRLYDRDIKEVPLVVERYGEGLLLIPSTDPVTSRTRAQQEDWLDLMARTASETLGVPLENVFVRGRTKDERGFRVREAGLEVEVRLSGRGSIGLEPSGREIRRWVKSEASDRRVLVLGPEAASFAAAADAGGALETTSVGPTDAEVATFLERKRDGETYDLVVLSVPDLAGWEDRWTSLSSRMAPRATLYVVARDSRSRLSRDLSDDWIVEDVTERSIPEEFRSRKLHRTWRITRR